MYYDKKLKIRQTEKHLKRRGLIKLGIDLETLGIVELIAVHGIDPDLYIPIDTGAVEVREDEKTYVIYKKENRTSDPATGFDVRRVMKDKVHSRRDSILVSGLKFSFGGETHVLQTRNATELVSWNTVYGKAQTLPADTPIKVRTEADKSVFIPAGSMVTLLEHMITYRTDVMDSSWIIKDFIDDAATDSEAFEAYESGIDTVWPDDSPIEL